MSTSKDTTTLVLVEYNAMVQMIESEKKISISLVEKVIQKLVIDTKNNPFAQDDEEGNATYKSSLRSRLKIIADFFGDSLISCEGMSDDYHNLAIDFARQEMFSEACMILERGCVLSIRIPQNRKGNSPFTDWEFLIFGKRHTADWPAA